MTSLVVFGLLTQWSFIMPTIEKNVEITANRRLQFDLEIPDDIPIGNANIQITITPILSPKNVWDALREFQGIFKDDPAFQGDPVEIQRKMRDE
jgi:hypothetical protein